MSPINPCSESGELHLTKSLVLVFTLALVLRLVWAWWIPVIPLSDGEAYDVFARTLVQHGTFGWTAEEPTAFWPPGTTFMHAALFWLFGIRYEPIIAINIALSLGIIWVSARLAARFWGQQVALISAVILAVWPTLVMYPTILASELPFLFLTLLAMDLWFNPKQALVPRALLVGLVLGLASLVRPQALLLPLVFAVASVLTRRPTFSEVKGQFKCVALAGLVMALVVAPWVWRNHLLYGEPVLISTNGGITLWMGNTPGTDGRYMAMPETVSHLPANEKARVLAQEAKNYIVQDPAAFLVRAVRKLVILYSNESVGVSWNAQGISQTFGPSWELRLKRATQASWALIFVLALAGIWSSMRRVGWVKALASPLTLSILYFTAIHMVVVSQDRYHLAFAGQLAIFAALGATEFLAWRRKRSSDQSSSALP